MLANFEIAMQDLPKILITKIRWFDDVNQKRKQNQQSFDYRSDFKTMISFIRSEIDAVTIRGQKKEMFVTLLCF